MRARTPVRDHVMMMTNNFTEAELHVTQIDEVTQVEIILNYQSTDFIQFTSNYIRNKLNYRLSRLLNGLQTFDSIRRQEKVNGSTNVADQASSSKAKPQKIKAFTYVRSAQGQASSLKGKEPAKDEKQKKRARTTSPRRQTSARKLKLQQREHVSIARTGVT